MRKVIAGCALLLTFSLSACTDHTPTDGQVIKTDSNPGYFMMTYCGKNCYINTYYPPTWSVKVQSSNADPQWVDVKESVYNQCRPGMHWHHELNTDEAHCD